VLLQLPLYVPPEVILMALGFVDGETKTVAEALLPSHVAVAVEEPTLIPINSPFPFEDKMVVSAACHVQCEGETATAPLAGAKSKLFPCTRLAVAGESCNTP
jgi:hypothetical protein